MHVQQSVETKNKRKGRSVKVGTKLSRLVVIVALAGAYAVFVAPPPAFADPERPGVDEVARLNIQKDGSPSAAPTVVCTGSAAPAPQYSSAGGPWGTVHYGAHVVCSQVGQLTVVVYLYSVHGYRENTRIEDEDTFAMFRTGSSAGGSRFVPCIGNFTARWIIAIYAQYNGINFTPYPSWSAEHSLPCGSG